MGNQKISRRVLGGKNNHPRFTARFGPVAVILALFIGLVSFLIFSGYTPIAPADSVVLGLFVANIIGILLVFCFVLAEAYALLKARRAGVAGAELHIRIVGLFSIIAAAPALLMAWVGSVTLERSLNPAFIEDQAQGLVFFCVVEVARLRADDGIANHGACVHPLDHRAVGLQESRGGEAKKTRP